MRRCWPLRLRPQKRIPRRDLRDSRSSPTVFCPIATRRSSRAFAASLANCRLSGSRPLHRRRLVGRTRGSDFRAHPGIGGREFHAGNFDRFEPLFAIVWSGARASTPEKFESCGGVTPISALAWTNCSTRMNFYCCPALQSRASMQARTTARRAPGCCATPRPSALPAFPRHDSMHFRRYATGRRARLRRATARAWRATRRPPEGGSNLVIFVQCEVAGLKWLLRQERLGLQ